jgi:hypothetical protein
MINNNIINPIYIAIRRLQPFSTVNLLPSNDKEDPSDLYSIVLQEINKKKN